MISAGLPSFFSFGTKGRSYSNFSGFYFYCTKIPEPYHLLYILIVVIYTVDPKKLEYSNFSGFYCNSAPRKHLMRPSKAQHGASKGSSRSLWQSQLGALGGPHMERHRPNICTRMHVCIHIYIFFVYIQYMYVHIHICMCLCVYIYVTYMYVYM